MICDCDAQRGPQKSQQFPRQEPAVLHCDLGVRWKVASDLRFRAAISEPKTPSFGRISGDLALSRRFWPRRLCPLGSGLGLLCLGEVNGRQRVGGFFLSGRCLTSILLGSCLGRRVLPFQSPHPNGYDVLMQCPHQPLAPLFVLFARKIWVRLQL